MTGSWVFFALGAFVAKSFPVIEGSWRYMGGASIVFHGIKTYIFGKLVRTIEFPDGEMVSIVIRTNNINRLKNEIIKHQPALFPGVELDFDDVKYLSRWTPPHFTEPCLKNKDLKMVPDGGVIFWSRFEPIPKRGVTLDIKDKDHIKLDQAIQYVSKLGKGGIADESIRLTETQENALIDLLLEKDEAILALHRNFSPYPSVFKYHALRYLNHKKGIQQEAHSKLKNEPIELSQPNQPQQSQQQQSQQQKQKPIQTDNKTSTKAPGADIVNTNL
ncbi:hypothetical protein DICPUDRAFT_38624 [Dictyostelium purpureum]|uniref:Uncharacterized protein n=1 Tax=Dictyostelium purpureum TaxID=5786 RepID=F0ZUU3_DICPU|nr:uncharacterized protein DICPUDRAFT_38624 [Dictyostelium purpureum]EGC32282.1 hypothetical protein DICPUDRAFT_38624 [Dictyostelium purpureum]|eukprot:XP_003291191.1 hypothetical protein DICPUDRAFT_38624 [Dictyostelium purpureum]